jgi:hypothetical protein
LKETDFCSIAITPRSMFTTLSCPPMIPHLSMCGKLSLRHEHSAGRPTNDTLIGDDDIITYSHLISKYTQLSFSSKLDKSLPNISPGRFPMVLLVKIDNHDGLDVRHVLGSLGGPLLLLNIQLSSSY